uniref:Multiple epidermal growth factor-like domains 10 n=1 Tax=Magallana gigas TaxID=29159 RepID=K1QMJ3_MAGGI
MNYTLETIPNLINITCPNQESGRYVIYYNNRTHPPYPDACPYGFFGKDCTDKCNYTCTGCNDVNGSCDSGCHPGWFGNYCNKACAVSSYGFECRETCGKCGDVSQCLSTNGTCLADCKDGYQGDLCKTPCTLGSYGLECRGRCGNCRMCSNTNGSCLTACDAGYLGEMCKTRCTPKGYFGSNCSVPCPDVNCQECHMESGICHVCKQGYKGQRCETGRDSLRSINHMIFKGHVMSTFRMCLETMIIVKS